MLGRVMDDPDDIEALDLICDSNGGIIDQDDGSTTRRFTCEEVGCLVVCNLAQYCYEDEEEGGSVLRQELPKERCIQGTSIDLKRI